MINGIKRNRSMKISVVTSQLSTFTVIIMNYEISRKELLVCRLEYIWQTILFYMSVPVGARTTVRNEVAK